MAKIEILKCHCGSVELELTLPNGFENLRKCNCSICGIYTHHQRRSVPSEYGFNIACVEGVKIEDYKDVRYLDGRDNHPKDTN